MEENLDGRGVNDNPKLQQNKKSLIYLGAGILFLVIILTLIYIGFIKKENSEEKTLPPIKILSIPLSKKIEESITTANSDGGGREAFAFNRVSLYQFQTTSSEGNEDGCIPTREWNTNRAYFVCGNKGEKVLALEGEYQNTSFDADVVLAKPGYFAVLQEEGNIEQEFKIQPNILVEPGVKYIYRVVFKQFELNSENIYRIVYSTRDPRVLLVDLDREMAMIEPYE